MDRLEYHFTVRHSTLFLTVILFALLSTGHAQMSPGTPPTGAVHPFTGAVRPPTATPPLTGRPGFAPSSSRPMHHDGDSHHRYSHGQYAPIYGYAVPYAVDPYAADPNAAGDGYDATDEANYQGGPTVFDRRGSGAKSYVPPVDDVPAPHADLALDSAPDPQPVQPLTVLVFKDGRQLEVGNYAIVGATLFDMTPGHPRRIALADLDLDATGKQNDDRGVVFQLPPSLQAN